MFTQENTTQNLKEQTTGAHTVAESHKHTAEWDKLAVTHYCRMTGKMNLWWLEDDRQNEPMVKKNHESVCLWGREKNCLGRNLREFSGGDENILFLKGVTYTWVHLFLTVNVCAFQCMYLLPHEKEKQLKKKWRVGSSLRYWWKRNGT